MTNKICFKSLLDIKNFKLVFKHHTKLPYIMIKTKLILKNYNNNLNNFRLCYKLSIIIYLIYIYIYIYHVNTIK